MQGDRVRVLHPFSVHASRDFMHTRTHTHTCAGHPVLRLMSLTISVSRVVDRAAREKKVSAINVMRTVIYTVFCERTAALLL